MGWSVSKSVTVVVGAAPTGTGTTSTGSTGDLTPPSLPTNLVTTAVGITQINLSWNASTDAVGVKGYKIYRGGTLIATTTNTGTTYSDTGLTPSTVYTYTIAAYDAAGNTSSVTVGVSGTTQTPKTYYIRQDGGTVTQCNWLVDAPYPWTGTGKPCAWINPMIAFPPMGWVSRISGGDTLMIGSWQYMIGYWAPWAEACSSSFPWDCAMASVPSGPNATYPTKIYGATYDQSCSNAPEFYWVERVNSILRLVGSSNIQVSCLNITDHESCGQNHSSWFGTGGFDAGKFACNRNVFPYGKWAAYGLVATDSQNVTLRDVFIHGLASGGMLVGRVKDWYSYNLRIIGNAFVGWDGDVGAFNSSNSGTLYFKNLSILWNGCVEKYPYDGTMGWCWGQWVGWYGDGLGTHQTAGDWIFEDSIFAHNVSDGLDLLYHSDTWSVTVRRSYAAYNAGNQLKIAGKSTVENTIILWFCAEFQWKPYTYNVDNCRAAGDAVALLTNTGHILNFTNNSVIADGNTVMIYSGTVQVTNNIFIGLPYALYPSFNSADIYLVWSSASKLIETNNIKQWLRNVTCTGTGTICWNAGVVNATRNAVDLHLASWSVAIDSGSPVDGVLVPNHDYVLQARPNGLGVDRGALEFVANLMTGTGGTSSGTTSTGTSLIYYTLSTSSVVNGTILRTPNTGSYLSGTVVTLTANANSGYTWSSWSGCTSSTNTCNVTMNQNRTVSAVFTDLTPPSLPTNLVTTAVGITQINLSWNASTDAVGVKGYKIYRGGTLIATTTNTGTTYSDTGLTPSTVYTYTIAAYDAAGNTSSVTVGVSGTTQTPKTYYIRQDGGTVTQCNWLVDAPYPWTGTGKPCAWINPMIAFPPMGWVSRISGGDTLMIGSWQYMIGYWAPWAEACSSSFPWDCAMASVPSGPNATYPTKIYGATYDQSCSNAPEFYWVERVNSILRLVGSSNIQVSCLNITDHESCGQNHSSWFGTGGFDAGKFACNRNVFPYGKWAAYGLVATDSQNVTLRDVFIHGLASGGMLVGRVKDWYSYNLRIIGNAFVGWDGDVGAFNSSNSGTLYFKNLSILWNGCVEKYPYDGTMGWCWGQWVGWYGDGLGTHQTAGDWIFEDSIFAHNVSDGLDLLYHSDTWSVTVRRSYAAYNAGNQLKIAGKSTVENTIILWFCAEFQWKPYTYNVDNCRAAGDAVALLTNTGHILNFTNNSVIADGNTVMIYSGTVQVTNNIFIGLPYALYPSFNSADIYLVWSSASKLIETNNIKQWLRNVTCTGTGTICWNAGVVNATRNAVDLHLASWSVAIDSGSPVDGVLVPNHDYVLQARPNGLGVDRGALEFVANLMTGTGGTSSGTTSTGTSLIYYTLSTSSVVNGTILRTPNTGSYLSGTVVTLTANANSGYTWSSWSGCTSSTNTCNVTMNQNRTVSAVFTALQPINGMCGTSQNQVVDIAPSINLCTTGTPSAVTGAWPWNWTCGWSNGGISVSCSANKQSIFTWSVPDFRRVEIPSAWNYTANYLDQSACWVGEGTIYEVWPNKAYINPRDIPWLSLMPCDQVLIYHRSTPYTDIVFIGSRWERWKYISIKGIPWPNGELPVFDGSWAVMPKNTWANQYTDLVWMIIIANPTNVMRAYGYKPWYIGISNLKIQNARTPNLATNINWIEQQWPQFVAWIYISPAEHIAITDCEFGDNWLWIFVNSQDLEYSQSRDILISRNYFHGNGILNNASLHNSYTEAIWVIYEFNYFAAPIKWTAGDNIKDRSAGIIFRYNYIEDGVNLISLRDPQSNADFESQAIDYLWDKLVSKAFIYGNTFVAKSPTVYNDSPVIIAHWDGIYGDGKHVRYWEIFFYNNRVISTIDKILYRTENIPLFALINTRLPTTVVAKNNLFYASSSTLNAQFAPFSLFLWQWSADWQSNWINQFQNVWAVSANGWLAVWTMFDWLWLGWLISSSGSPWFTNFSSGNYSFVSNSPYHSLDATLPPAISNRWLIPLYNPVIAPFWLPSYLDGGTTWSTSTWSTGTGILFGVNVHRGWADAIQIQKYADILQNRNLRVARFDFAYDWNPQVIRGQIDKFKTVGVNSEVVLFTQHQWSITSSADCNWSLTWAEQTAYNQTVTMVNGLKDVVTDFELMNEVPWIWLLQAEVPWNSAMNNTSIYYNKPCYEMYARVLKGMSQAIVDIRNTSGLPLKIFLGTIGRDFAFLTFMKERWVIFDEIGYHIYPAVWHASLDTDPWFGSGWLFTQLAQFNTKVHLNEFNCAEIYDATYTNIETWSTTVENCYKSIKKHMAEILTQNKVSIKNLIFYELLNEPWKPAPENRFGLMFDLDHPKIQMYQASYYASGFLSPTELNTLTTRSLTQ
jgi:chitodextrinase